MSQQRYFESISELDSKFLELYQSTASQFNRDIKQIGPNDRNIDLSIDLSKHNPVDSTRAEELLNIHFPYWAWKRAIYWPWESTTNQPRQATNHDFDPIYSLTQVFESELDKLKAKLSKHKGSRSKLQERALRLIGWQKEKSICLLNAYLAELEYLIITKKAQLISYPLPKNKQTERDILSQHQTFTQRLKQRNTKAKKNHHRRRVHSLNKIRGKNIACAIKKQEQTHKMHQTKLQHITDWMLEFQSTNHISDRIKYYVELLAPIFGVICAIIVIALIVTPTSTPIMIMVATILSWASYIGYLPNLIMLTESTRKIAYTHRPNKLAIVDMMLCIISLLLQIPTPALSIFVKQTVQLASVFLDLIALLILTLRPLWNMRFTRGEAFYSRHIFSEYTSFIQHVKASTIYHYHNSLTKNPSSNLQLPASYKPLLKNYTKTWPYHTGRHHSKLVTLLIKRIDNEPHTLISPLQQQADAFYSILRDASHSSHNKTTDGLIKSLETLFTRYDMNHTGSFARRMKYITLRLHHERERAKQQDINQTTNPNRMFQPRTEKQTAPTKRRQDYRT